MPPSALDYWIRYCPKKPRKDKMTKKEIRRKIIQSTKEFTYVELLSALKHIKGTVNLRMNRIVERLSKALQCCNSPAQLKRGGALRVESLEPVLRSVTFNDKALHISALSESEKLQITWKAKYIGCRKTIQHRTYRLLGLRYQISERFGMLDQYQIYAKTRFRWVNSWELRALEEDK